MQRNPSKTPADLALSSRFICLKPPSLCTHVANLLSVAFFLFIWKQETRFSVSVRYHSSTGFLPMDLSQQRGLARCWLESVVAGLTGGFILGSVPNAAKLTKTFTSQPSAWWFASQESHTVVACLPPQTHLERIFYLARRKIFWNEAQGLQQQGKATPGGAWPGDGSTAVV